MIDLLSRIYCNHVHVSCDCGVVSASRGRGESVLINRTVCVCCLFPKDRGQEES